MKNKKGFTLVEIIVCLVLIIMVGTISIITFKKDEKEPKKELVGLVTESASVKYLSSITEIKEIQETYGYKVYKVQELIDKGMLEENKFKSLLENIIVEPGKDYSKIILKYDYSNVGEIEYRYPYESNDNTFLAKSFDDIVFIKDNNAFNCKEGITKLKYLDENYEVKEIGDIDSADLRCKESESNSLLENINNDINAGIFNNDYKTDLNLGTGEYYINYVLKVDDKYYQTYENREVVIVSTNNLSIKIKDNNGNEITDTGNWHKGPLLAYISTDEGQIDINEYIDLLGEGNFEIDWNVSKTGYSIDDINKVLTIVDDGTYTISSNVRMKGKTTPLDLVSLKIDSTSPTIIGEVSVNRDLKTITVAAEDITSGLKSIELYKNEQLVSMRDNISLNSTTHTTTHTFNDISVTELDNYIVKITDNAGNSIEKRLNNIPYFNIKAIKKSVFDFSIEVDNIKSIYIDFDIPKITDNNTEHGIYLDEALDYNYSSDTEEGLTGIYEFSFLNIADKIINWYRKYYSWYNNTRVNTNILNDLMLDCNVLMIDLNGNEIKYDYEVKLNATDEYNYFGGKLFSYSGWYSEILAFNENSDILFYLHNKGSNKKLYLARYRKSLEELLTVYSGDVGPTILSFDTKQINYAYTDKGGSTKNGSSTKKYYFYTYDLNKDVSSYFETTKDKYWDEYRGNIMPDKYTNGTWPKLINQTYYSSLSNYLTKYKTLEKVTTSGVSSLVISKSYDYAIFKHSDGWKSFLTYTIVGGSLDTYMYFYKEEVSITEK